MKNLTFSEWENQLNPVQDDNGFNIDFIVENSEKKYSDIFQIDLNLEQLEKERRAWSLYYKNKQYVMKVGVDFESLGIFVTEISSIDTIVKGNLTENFA